MRAIDRRIRQLLKKYEPAVQREFLAAIQDISDSVKLKNLVEAISRNDLDAALVAIDYDRAAFSQAIGAITEAYSAAGSIVSTSPVFRNTGVIVRWDMHNPRAQNHIATISSNFITIISNEVKEVVRETIAAGYALGRGPQSIALDLVGRVAASGRKGGVIGLSRPQARYVTNMRKYIESGDISTYLGMTRRDRRYDSMVRKGGLTAAQIDKILERYADRLLQTRANTIARTETAQAVEASRQEAFKQWADKTGANPDSIVRRWDHPGGKNSRDWHSDMNGMEVRGMDEPFITPRGARMMHPLDTSLGAGPEEIANCRCMQTIYIDYKVLRDE